MSLDAAQPQPQGREELVEEAMAAQAFLGAWVSPDHPLETRSDADLREYVEHAARVRDGQQRRSTEIASMAEILRGQVESTTAVFDSALAAKYCKARGIESVGRVGGKIEDLEEGALRDLVRVCLEGII